MAKETQKLKAAGKFVKPTAPKPAPSSSKSVSTDKAVSKSLSGLSESLGALGGLVERLGKTDAAAPIAPTGPTDEQIRQRELDFIRQQDAAAEAERKRRTGQSGWDNLRLQFSSFNLDSLLEDVKRLIIDGASEEQLLLEIRKTPAWEKRFAANKTRLAKGLRVLSEGEYIDLETKYQDIMRNYGLPASYYSKTATGTNEFFERLIGGNVSPVKLEEKIMIGTNRVINASPFVTTALKQFFPNITNGDILAYVLDPDRGLDEINRKVLAAEIGGAAMGAQLDTTLGRAEELARYGVTAETARAGFGAIGGGLERGRQLASIYQQPDYTQAVAEEEVFNLPGQTQAGEKRRKIIGLEKAEFGGQTGMTSGALSRDRAGSY
jgi:hypothetical protein